MARKSILYIALSLLLFSSSGLYSQKEGVSGIDSVMAISPYYMPVKYTFIKPHFFELQTPFDIDTAIDRTAYFNALFPVENMYQSLGILYQAHQKINFDFKKEAGFSYIQLPYTLYFNQQEDLPFYLLDKSYTRLAYTFGIPQENSFDAVHAQKFKKDVTAIFNLHAFNNPGRFLNQNTGYFSGDATLHYAIPSQFYGFKLSYIFNRFNLQENGGLADFNDENIDLYDYRSFLKKEAPNLINYTVNTPQASSKIVSNDLLFQQYSNFKVKQKYIGTITHSFQFKSINSYYLNPDSSSRENTLYGVDSLFDSLRYYSITNSLQWSNYSLLDDVVNKRSFFHYAGGIMHEYLDDKLTRYFNNTYTLFGHIHTRFFSVIDITGRLSYAFSGYHANDAIADASVTWAIQRDKRHFAGLTGSYSRVSPDFIFSRYEGSALRWEISHKKQNIFKANLFWSYSGMSVNLNYFMLHQYTIFNQDLHPYTLEDPARIIQLNILTPFKIKNFGINTHLSVQHATNEYISLPVFSGKAALYYIFFLFKNKMQLQLGLDMMYNTKYHANAYSPLLHQFYYQNEFENGNFFYLDANVNIKVERIHFFFKINNILAGFAGQNYFTTPYYPMSAQKIAIGINWRFYD